MVRARPSVSRDGGLAVFVNAENDLCFITTDGDDNSVMSLPTLLLRLPCPPTVGWLESC